MKSIPSILLIIMIAILLCFAGCLQEQEPQTMTDTSREAMHRLLGEATGAIQATLSNLDASTSDAATALGTTGLSGPLADRVLNRLAGIHPARWAVFFVTDTWAKAFLHRGPPTGMAPGSGRRRSG